MKLPSLRLAARGASVAVLSLLGLTAGAAHAQWVNIGGPPGFSGQLGVIYGATAPATPKVMYLAAGFSHVWSAPLGGGGGALQWTALPSTGLGSPWAIDRMVVNAADAPVLSLFNIQNGTQNMLMVLDKASGVWKTSSIQNSLFLNPPRIVVAGNGDILASYANAVFASSDGGASFALRDDVSDSMAAPLPLPPGGGAVGTPAYGTNAVNSGLLPGYTETMTTMPWGELFLGTEVTQEWHSFDNGATWEHIDPLFFEPQRDMAGIPQYSNGHMTPFGRAGNTAGAGFTKDAEIILNSDRNNGQNFYRMNTTGQIVAIDTSTINLTHNGTVERFGQVKEFHTLLSGETLTCPVSWQLNQGGLTPDGRNNTEVVDWSGGALSISSPALGGAWIPYYSDGSGGADDGLRYYALAAASSSNLMMYTPPPAQHTRPDIAVGGSPVTVAIAAGTGVASLVPAPSFTVNDWLPVGKRLHSWSARGAGPVTFDDPFALGAVAYFGVPGWYVVTLTVSDGQLSSGMSLTVHVLPAKGGAAPVIQKQPVNQPIAIGGMAQYAVSAVGAQLAYRWYRNGVELTDGGRYSGTTTSQLTISGITGLDWDASFYCLVWNAFGRVMSNAGLLGGAPVITTAPADAVAVAGAAGTLSVAANGSQPMRWQWYSVNGGQRTPVAQGGQTSGLTTTTPGTYQVDITNCFGTVTSASARLSNGAATTFELDLVAGNSPSASGGGLYNGVGGTSAPIAITADRFGPVDTNFVFSSWSSSSPKVKFGNASSPQTYVIVTGANSGEKIAVNSSYSGASSFALSVVNGVGGGTTRPTTFVAGQTVEVAAHSAPTGTVFDHWVGGPIDGSVNPAATFTLPAADTRVTAVYRSTTGASPDLATVPADLASAPPDLALARDSMAVIVDLATRVDLSSRADATGTDATGADAATMADASTVAGAIPVADASTGTDDAATGTDALTMSDPDAMPSVASGTDGATPAPIDGGAMDSSCAPVAAPVAGCGCELAGRRAPPGVGLGWVLLLLPLVRRRRARR